MKCLVTSISDVENYFLLQKKKATDAVDIYLVLLRFSNEIAISELRSGINQFKIANLHSQ